MFNSYRNDSRVSFFFGKMSMVCLKERDNLKFKKWICATAASILLAATLNTTSIAKAEVTKSIADESIYDVLVDRYFNGTGENDYKVDPLDPSKFAGGDFKGIEQQLSLISQMGFSILSLGSVFATETYNGTMTTNYSEIEPQFGTSEEFTSLIKTLNENQIKAMIDFPLTNVSANHEWAKDPSKADWIVGKSGNKIRWDLRNVDVQDALIDSVVNFISTYNIEGVRLTNLDIADTAFLNKMIEAIKKVNNEIYVISNEESDANFDATFYDENHETYRNIYKNVDQDSSNQLKHVEPFAKGEGLPTQLMIDNLNTDRFVLDVEAFPPTRLKLSVASTLLLPGVPVMQYGTEIAMNGEAGPEAHQLYNFKTDDELVNYIANIQTLRNKSETLRRGEFKLIKNENGFLAFERYSDDERWIVVINNTGKTTRVDISANDIGEDKELRGMLESDVIRSNDDGIYPIVLDREVVEVFQVIDKVGINKLYIVLLAIVYVLFISFIVAMMRRSKRKRALEK